MKKKKVYFDASVIFSALYSQKGGSNKLLHLVKQKKIIGITSQTVIEEVTKNIEKLPLKKDIAQLMLDFNFLVIIKITKRQIQSFTRFIHEKDAHVLAGAILSEADYLVTLDKKHINNESVKKNFKKPKILSPKKLFFLSNFSQKKSSIYST